MWQSRRPRERLCFAWLSIRGTCTPQSSCRLLRPVHGECQPQVWLSRFIVNDLRHQRRVITHLCWCDRFLGCLVQLFDRLAIFAKIGFAANKDNGKTWAEVQNLRDPLSTRFVSMCELGCPIDLSSPSPGRCQESQGSRRRNRSG